MIQKYKHEIIIALLIICASITFYYLYGLLLPFIIGLILAFSAFSIILKIKKIVRSKSLSIIVFLTFIAGILILSSIFLTKFINRDFKRLNKSFTTLVESNKETLDKSAQKAKEYIGEFYDLDELQNKLIAQSDSLKMSLKEMDNSKLDTESIKASFEEIKSIFSSDDKTDTDKNNTEFGFLFILFSTIMYFILILFQMDYFMSIKKRYFNNKIKSKTNIIIEDFNQSFVKYFKLRTKIVLILSLIYFTAFLIMDMPGMILLTILIIILSYIPYLQYIALLPLMIGSLVVSIENDQSFLLIFGIIIAVFIIASIIEELILTPWIMEKNIGMNPVIMILALSVWSYALGLQGILIGIPLTSLMIIYFKRYILTSYNEISKE